MHYAIALAAISKKEIILDRNGDFRPSDMIGPGGYPTKIWKTLSGAKRYAASRFGENWQDHVRIIYA